MMARSGIADPVVSRTVPEMLPVVWALAPAQQKARAAAITSCAPILEQTFIGRRSRRQNTLPHHAAKNRNSRLNRRKTSPSADLSINRNCLEGVENQGVHNQSIENVLGTAPRITACGPAFCRPASPDTRAT